MFVVKFGKNELLLLVIYFWILIERNKVMMNRLKNYENLF